MISALCWVPKGASKYSPEVADEKPPTKEEIEAVIQTGVLNRGGNVEVEDEEMEMETEVDGSGQANEVEKALAAVEALGGNREEKGSGSRLPDVADALRELNMDRYDDEGGGMNIFSSGLGDVYYPSNECDPYLTHHDDNDFEDEEIEDMTIRPTDGVVVCAHNEDESNHLEILVYEEAVDGESNMYVHHEIILPAFPLCVEWFDCNLKSGDKGNFIAVGSMEPAIEIWDLDVLDEAEPFKALGGTVTKRIKGQRPSVKYKKSSHRDAVLGLSWNKEIRNVLASASADKSVKVWNIETGQCALTVKHHSDKVQVVAWSQHSPEVLLSGSFDHSVVMMDMRSNAQAVHKWPVTADVESLKWDPHTENNFVVSLENGTVQGVDTRMIASDSSSSSKSTFTLHAHDKAVCSVSYNPAAANLLATGSSDKMVKLWDISNNQPACVASSNPKAGAIFSIAFYESSPFLLAIGGSKGKLHVWDTMTDPGVVGKFGQPFKTSNIAPSED